MSLNNKGFHDKIKHILHSTCSKLAKKITFILKTVLLVITHLEQGSRSKFWLLGFFLLFKATMIMNI